MTVCEFPTCERVSGRLGLCLQHLRQQRSGRPLTPIQPRVARSGACSVEWCEKGVGAGGLCWAHYEQHRRGEELGPIRRRNASPECRVPDCTSRNRSYGLCVSHYRAVERFGLTVDDAITLFTDPKCGICDTSESGAHDFHIDHDHACCSESGRSCGKCVRGLLCSGCNTGIGFFGDDLTLLARAMTYLSESKVVSLAA